MQSVIETRLQSIAQLQKQCQEIGCWARFPAADEHYYCVEHDVCVHKGAFDPEACLGCRELVKIVQHGDEQDLSTHVARQLLTHRWTAACAIFANLTWKNASLPVWLRLVIDPKNVYDDRGKGRGLLTSSWWSELPAMERGRVIPKANIDHANLVLAKLFGEGVITVKPLADDQVEYYCWPCRLRLDGVSNMEEHSTSPRHQQMAMMDRGSADLTNASSLPASLDSTYVTSSSSTLNPSYVPLEPATLDSAYIPSSSSTLDSAYGLSSPASHNLVKSLSFPSSQISNSNPNPSSHITDSKSYPASLSSTQINSHPASQISNSNFNLVSLGSTRINPYPADHITESKPYPASHISNSSPYPTSRITGSNPYPTTSITNLNPYPASSITNSNPYPASNITNSNPYPASLISTQNHSNSASYNVPGLSYPDKHILNSHTYPAGLKPTDRNPYPTGSITDSNPFSAGLKPTASVSPTESHSNSAVLSSKDAQPFCTSLNPAGIVSPNDMVSTLVGSKPIEKKWFSVTPRDGQDRNGKLNQELYSSNQQGIGVRDLRGYEDDCDEARSSSRGHIPTSSSSQDHSRDRPRSTHCTSRVSSSCREVSRSRSPRSSWSDRHRRSRQPSSSSHPSRHHKHALTWQDKDKIMRILVEDGGSVTLEKLNDIVKGRDAKDPREERLRNGHRRSRSRSTQERSRNSEGRPRNTEGRSRNSEGWSGNCERNRSRNTAGNKSSNDQDGRLGNGQEGSRNDERNRSRNHMKNKPASWRRRRNRSKNLPKNGLGGGQEIKSKDAWGLMLSA